MNNRVEINSIFDSLISIWKCIGARRRWQYVLLLCLIISVAITEIFSIGALIPFLGILSNPGYFFNHPSAQLLIKHLGILSPAELLFPITVFFIVASIMAGIMRILVLWFSTELSFGTGMDIAVMMYANCLNEPYEKHTSRNSGEIINRIAGKSNAVIFGVITPALNFITSICIMLGIVACLTFIDPLITITAFAGFSVIYLLVTYFTKTRLFADGALVSTESVKVIQALQDGLGGIRDVLLDNTQQLYCDVFKKSDETMRKAQSRIAFLGQSPRYGIEALGMVLMALLAYTLVERSSNFSAAIPILGAISLGAQRLLPLMQQAYSSWIGMAGSKGVLEDVIELLPKHEGIKEIPETEPFPFAKKIELHNAYFRYATSSSDVLKKINLTINKGDYIGFVGKTGAGKSTLLDILMGLLLPSSGELRIDGVALNDINIQGWRSHIAHVPQNIFLCDATIEENIAFGVPVEKIDVSKVRIAAAQAQILDDIESWDFGFKTRVGERGIKLSGGQRQRLGIARALYKDADVLVLDEATSSLDGNTELKVMENIKGLGREVTVLIIAHRKTTLHSCSRIFNIADGAIKSIVTYEELMEESP